jgi:acetyl-CoA decarbonylase/synthase complex subunit gamma
MAPLLLPWLPSRSFALKGACLGLLWAAAWLWLAPTGLLDGASVTLLTTAIISFMTLTFTGATTFTTLSGVRLEMRYAVPALMTTAGAGILFAVLAMIR